MTKVRCAIYTRKSSEEGLEQDFNSLHAQREACAAYILSQASEGWSLLPQEYDDGGLSGGSLERPALRRLLADIASGKVDIVVVYKVDRLTRSLLDFSRLVEAFDKAGTSFVSVTQSFNTTTSMGRLTLNMLLSFAQFEREVTAERIRDKIAASKARGMWMGGVTPLGYQPDGRTLAIVEEHAQLIRNLFQRYLAVGNVRRLAEQLDEEQILVPLRTASTGRSMGGGRFSRGQIYKILSNPIYLGEIHHKGKVYQGKHDAIVDRHLWDQVQLRLSDNTQGSQTAATIRSSSLLAGLVFDAEGEPLVASHACKGKTRYRYYVSRRLQHEPGSEQDGMRIPARELEGAVVERLANFLNDPLAAISSLGGEIDPVRLRTAAASSQGLASEVRGKKRCTIRTLVSRITILPDELRLELNLNKLGSQLGLKPADEALPPIVLALPAQLARSSRGIRLVHPGKSDGRARDPDQPMIGLLVKARQWWDRLAKGGIDIATLAREEAINASYVSRVVRLNFLAPQLVESILEGRQPPLLDVARLTSSGAFPLGWKEQLDVFG